MVVLCVVEGRIRARSRSSWHRTLVGQALAYACFEPAAAVRCSSWWCRWQIGLRAHVVSLAHPLGRVVAFPEQRSSCVVADDLAGSYTTSTASV